MFANDSTGTLAPESLEACKKNGDIFFSISTNPFELVFCQTAAEAAAYETERMLGTRQAAWHRYGGSANTDGAETSHASFTCGTGLNSYTSPCHYPEITDAYATTLTQEAASARTRRAAPTYTMKIRTNVFEVSDKEKFPPAFCTVFGF